MTDKPENQTMAAGSNMKGHFYARTYTGFDISYVR